MVPKSDFNKELARQIIAARKSRKVTQAEVFTDTRIHVGRIEMGDQAITVYTLCRLCEYLRIDVDSMLKRVMTTCKPVTEFPG